MEIREFLARDYARLVNAMALLSGSFPAAEDAVQEALARAWEAGEAGQRIDSLGTWIAVVARNLLRDRFRRLVRERRARARLVRPDDGQRVFGLVEDRTDLERALAGLPRRQREVSVFHYYLDLEVAQISDLLRMPEGTVKSALFRARRTLAEALGERDATVEVGDVTG